MGMCEDGGLTMYGHLGRMEVYYTITNGSTTLVEGIHGDLPGREDIPGREDLLYY